MRKWRGIAAAVLLVACGSSERSHAERGDSTRTPAAAPAPTRIDTLRDDQGEYFSPSWTSFVLTRAGRVVALDQDDQRIVMFDSSGRQRHSVGRNGAGPGEFRFPRRIFSLPGDSIAVWDIGLRRLSLFDSALKFDRTEQFPRWDFAGDESELVGRLADGRWVARLVAHGSFDHFRVGARLAIDTARLMVGHSSASPVEFHPLPLRTGVDVVMKMGSNNYNIFKLRLSELNVGVGVVCDSGAMLLDAQGVRVLDMNGRVVRASPLPRSGDSIRTAAERKNIVKFQMSDAVDSSSSAGATRALLEPLVAAHSTRMLRPTIDVNGGLWYDRNSTLHHDPPTVIERVDGAGRTDAALTFAQFGGGAQIGTNSVAMMQYGSDTTGLTLTLSQLPSGVNTSAERPIGRCFASFRY